MGRLRELADKVFKNRSSSQMPLPKITPDEKELESYKRREYLDGVKRQLVRYRKQHELLNQKGTYDTKHQILKAKEVFKNKERYNLQGGTNMKKGKKGLRFRNAGNLVKGWG
jgi:hypothetical protein